MAKVLFISVQDVKREPILDGSIDPDKIVKNIEKAQDKHIHNYLGTRLYEKMQELITAGTISDAGNSDYKFILDEYIQKMLVYYSIIEYLKYAQYTVSNKGVFKHTSENSENATTNEVSSLINEVIDDAQWWAKRFNRYMCHNSELFPEYTNNTEDDLYPDKDPSFGIGWVL